MTTLLSVTSSILVGVTLVVSPWTTFWDANHLLQAHPLFRAIMLNAFVRGAVSGLGFANLLLAAIEVHAHLRGSDGHSPS